MTSISWCHFILKIALGPILLSRTLLTEFIVQNNVDWFQFRNTQEYPFLWKSVYTAIKWDLIKYCLFILLLKSLNKEITYYYYHYYLNMKQKLFYTCEQTLHAFQKGSRPCSTEVNTFPHACWAILLTSGTFMFPYYAQDKILFFFTETPSRVNDLNKNNPVTHGALHLLFFRGRYQRFNSKTKFLCIF